jgi:hypothetical protein
MNTSHAMLREIMIIAASLAALFSIAASVTRSRGASGMIVSMLHYSGYGLMFISIILFIIIGMAG